TAEVEDAVHRMRLATIELITDHPNTRATQQVSKPCPIHVCSARQRQTLQLATGPGYPGFRSVCRDCALDPSRTETRDILSEATCRCRRACRFGLELLPAGADPRCLTICPTRVASGHLPVARAYAVPRRKCRKLRAAIRFCSGTSTVCDKPATPAPFRFTQASGRDLRRRFYPALMRRPLWTL